MKAVRIHARSGPEALVYEEAPTPEINDGEVLIRVHAAAITPTEFTWNSTSTTSDGRERLPIVPSFEVSGEVAKVASGVEPMSSGQLQERSQLFYKNSEQTKS